MNNIIVSDEAYKHESGPLLLLAGPGTGKTYQLAKRIQHLVNERDASPDEITVITFTTEAAKGMRLKLAQYGSSEFVEPDKRPKQIMTMHALGHLIITENLHLVGLDRDFVVVEDSDVRRALLLDAALLLGFREAEATAAFGDRTHANPDPPETTRRILAQYESILRASNAIDYDDQITLACTILRRDEHLRTRYARRTRHLLVDEYQDINKAQFDLISLLSENSRDGLFVVGDDDQSIYGFRGGDPSYIRTFRAQFGPSSVLMQMQTSRRCPEHVLESASSIVSNFDSNRVPKGNYVYAQAGKGKVILHDCPSDDREAEIICTIVKDSIKKAEEDKCADTSHFILIPNRNYANKMQETLEKFGIAFDSRFSEQETALADFLCFRQWVEHVESNFDLRRVIALLTESGILGISSCRARKPEKVRARMEGLREIAKLWEKVIAERRPLWGVLSDAAPNSDLLGILRRELGALRDCYQNDNLPEFLQGLVSCARPWSSVRAFYKDITRVLHPRRSVVFSPHVVRLLTLQSAKGLQALNVYIIGLEEEILPRRVADDGALSEEARLLFVGMTRAQNELHLFKCRRRTSASTYRPIPHDLKPSRFVACLPPARHEKRFHQADSVRKRPRQRDHLD